jgi:NAD(P)-dependent dehydrogenase (short-subunit alcohol dehydrogenase family)
MGLGRRVGSARTVESSDQPEKGTLMTLNGARVVVLGGASGIGYAVAESAARAGAQVSVVSSNPERVAQAVESLPDGTTGHPIDLTDAPAIATHLRQSGPIDHLVFTAGENISLSTLDDLDLAGAREYFTLRYFGALAAVKAAVPQIRRGGSIVLTTGVAADRPHPGWSVGASICGAVGALTRALAVELAPIRVNAVSPGVVRSPLWDSMDDSARERLYRDTAKTLPVGRVGEPRDIAEAYLYLMNERFATGSILTVDGGGVLV